MFRVRVGSPILLLAALIPFDIEQIPLLGATCQSISVVHVFSRNIHAHGYNYLL